MTTGVGMFGPIGMQELLIVLLIAVLIFGAARIPEIAKSLGKALKQRQIVFFAVILILALISFRLLRTLLTG